MLALSLIFLFSKLENLYGVFSRQRRHLYGVAIVARANIMSVHLSQIKHQEGVCSLEIREFCFKLLSNGTDQSFSSRGTKIIGLAMLLFIV